LARLEWSERALASLDQLVLTHSLPTDTRLQIEESARPLTRFPRFGPRIKELQGNAELRFLIGPWPWLVIVHAFFMTENRVVIVSVEDGRTAASTVTRDR
jgi:plasmid stabilization system protein ParE